MPKTNEKRIIPEFAPADFHPLAQSLFHASIGEAPAVDLKLAEIALLPSPPGAPRPNPFSLLFLGPPSPILPQKIYRFSHPSLGEFDLFIVPVGPAPGGAMRYEAIFN
jgi:hypothetical protein